MRLLVIWLLWHFNSIKVQLEHLTLVRIKTSSSYFNSIKVQLEHGKASGYISNYVVFQFHKGTIRTGKRQSLRGQERPISIP